MQFKEKPYVINHYNLDVLKSFDTEITKLEYLEDR